MNQKYILFDFDGVIADSWASCFEVNKLMCPNITETDYQKAFNGNIKDWDNSSIVHTEKCRHDINFFDELIPRLIVQATIFAGMKNVIEELAKSYKLIIVSSTISAPINELLQKFNITPYFTEVMGYEVHSSKVEKIKIIFAKYNATSNDCVFITDTLGDMREAEKCSVKSIGVSWGFQDKETLLHGQPFAIADSPATLKNTIENYFKSII